MISIAASCARTFASTCLVIDLAGVRTRTFEACGGRRHMTALKANSKAAWVLNVDLTQSVLGALHSCSSIEGPSSLQSWGSSGALHLDSDFVACRPESWMRSFSGNFHPISEPFARDGIWFHPQPLALRHHGSMSEEWRRRCPEARAPDRHTEILGEGRGRGRTAALSHRHRYRGGRECSCRECVASRRCWRSPACKPLSIGGGGASAIAGRHTQEIQRRFFYRARAGEATERRCGSVGCRGTAIASPRSQVHVHRISDRRNESRRAECFSWHALGYGDSRNKRWRCSSDAGLATRSQAVTHWSAVVRSRSLLQSPHHRVGVRCRARLAAIDHAQGSPPAGLARVAPWAGPSERARPISAMAPLCMRRACMQGNTCVHCPQAEHAARTQSTLHARRARYACVRSDVCLTRSCHAHAPESHLRAVVARDGVGHADHVVPTGHAAAVLHW